MKKTASIVNRSVAHFANVLGLSPTSHFESKVRHHLSRKIIDVIKRKELTYLQVAKLAHTYPMNVNAILNQRTHDIPTHLMLRILVSLGIRAKPQSKS